MLLQHIKGELTLKEREKVIAWIDESEQNEAYYINLLNMVVAEDIMRKNPSINLSNDEKEASFTEIQKDIANGRISRKQELFFVGRNRKGLKRLLYLSACAVILLCISVGINIIQYTGGLSNGDVVADGEFIQESLPVANNDQTFYTENGVKAKIMLPDSSVVWLNSGSTITYPQNFHKTARLVKFCGEGYFEVRKNELAPMVVTTPRGMQITVLGTKFHICSYNDDSEEHATLFSGKINISRIVNNRVVVREKEMKPLESVSFNSVNRAVLTENADTTKKIAWKRGELLFEKTPMPEVIKRLERWHGVEITVKDPTILKHHFTAEFGSESIVQILELLKFTTPIDFSIEKNKVQLYCR